MPLIDKLNKLQPIKPADSLILKAEYKTFEETTGQNRTRTREGPPTEFGDLGILLGYLNSNKRKFYTLFDFSKPVDKNTFLRDKKALLLCPISGTQSAQSG